MKKEKLEIVEKMRHKYNSDEWITMNGAHVLVDDETGELQGTVGNAIRERNSGGSNDTTGDGRPKKYDILGNEVATTKLTDDVKNAFSDANKALDNMKQEVLNQYNSNLLPEYRVSSFDELSQSEKQQVRNVEYDIEQASKILTDDYPKSDDVASAQEYLAERASHAKDDLYMAEMDKDDYQYEYSMAKASYDIVNNLSEALNKLEPEKQGGK